LDVAVYWEEETKRYQNDKAGIEELLDHITGIQPQLIAVEASGGYERHVVETLILRRFQVSVVNPTRVQALAKAMGILAKTDRIDAQFIATYAKKIQPMPKSLQEKPEIEIKHMLDNLPVWQAQIDRLLSIPSVGIITAITVVVNMPELDLLDRQKIAALAGLAPYNQDSGKKAYPIHTDCLISTHSPDRCRAERWFF
jgi:transposase